MPKTSRDYLRRKAAQIEFHQDTAMNRALELAEIFKDAHPELAEGLLASAELTLRAQELIYVFCELAWGMDKETLHLWRK